MKETFLSLEVKKHLWQISPCHLLTSPKEYVDRLLDAIGQSSRPGEKKQPGLHVDGEVSVPQNAFREGT